MIRLVSGLFVLLLTSIVPTAIADVTEFSEGIQERNLRDLQTEHRSGEATHMPWIGSWWPYTQDGIAALSSDDETESATEKYDRLMGQRRQNSSTGWEKENHGPDLPDVQSWWGHCNGWTAAALLNPEPKRPVELNGISFTSADIKALLSETHMEVAADFLGVRNNEEHDQDSPAYRDVTPAQFHLTLTNLIGRLGIPFAMDKSANHEVWNHPVVAYRTGRISRNDYLGEDPDAPGVYRVRVTTTVWYASDAVAPTDLSPTFRFQRYSDYYLREEYQYILWLDAPLDFGWMGAIRESGDILQLTDEQTGEVLGGEWESADHPDFLWLPYAVTPSSGYKNPMIDDEAVDQISRGVVPGSSE